MSEFVPGSTAVWRDYLRAYGHIVAERFVAGSTVSLSYFVGDHLASTTVLSDANQNEQGYDSWDVWGKRRKPSGNPWNGCFASNPKSLTLRGYTGQEMLDTYCLVNLNARLYDPSIGRMVSANSVVPHPMSGQSFNRYSYVENNPLKFVDPTGHTQQCPGADCPQVKIISIECMEGSPCWGCSGEGVWSVADDGTAISAEFAGDAFSANETPAELDSASYQGNPAGTGAPGGGQGSAMQNAPTNSSSCGGNGVDCVIIQGDRTAYLEGAAMSPPYDLTGSQEQLMYNDAVADEDLRYGLLKALGWLASALLDKLEAPAPIPNSIDIAVESYSEGGYDSSVYDRYDQELVDYMNAVDVQQDAQQGYYVPLGGGVYILNDNAVYGGGP